MISTSICHGCPFLLFLVTIDYSAGGFFRGGGAKQIDVALNIFCFHIPCSHGSALWNDNVVCIQILNSPIKCSGFGVCAAHSVPSNMRHKNNTQNNPFSAPQISSEWINKWIFTLFFYLLSKMSSREKYGYVIGIQWKLEMSVRPKHFTQ